MVDPLPPQTLSEVVWQTGSADVKCIGASMEPTIAAGASVTIEHCRRPRADDVVLFHSGGELVLHHAIWYPPVLHRFAHVGDRPGARAGIAAGGAIVGRERLPRRKPTLSQCWHGPRHIVEMIISRTSGTSRWRSK